MPVSKENGCVNFTETIEGTTFSIAWRHTASDSWFCTGTMGMLAESSAWDPSLTVISNRTTRMGSISADDIQLFSFGLDVDM
jgi:hypothetical protein